MEFLKKIFNNKTLESDRGSSDNPLKKLSRKKIIYLAVGGGLLLTIVIGYVMVQNIRAENCLISQRDTRTQRAKSQSGFFTKRQRI